MAMYKGYFKEKLRGSLRCSYCGNKITHPLKYKYCSEKCSKLSRDEKRHIDSKVIVVSENIPLFEDMLELFNEEEQKNPREKFKYSKKQPKTS